MSSTNDEPKPRASPLDYRNTELVSRLLAATPPYLYNMPLVPHSYFFSEMLRSFVQAKQESRSAAAPAASTVAAAGGGQHPNALHRRPRKRSGWSQPQHRYDWTSKNSSNAVAAGPLTEHKPSANNNNHNVPEKPLELTMNKIAAEETEEKIAVAPDPNANPNQNASDLILPPPPPIWYPPIYPAPYGIDPLHFFIDLRVSGHIYDGKNQKEMSPKNEMPLPTTKMEYSTKEDEERQDILQNTLKTDPIIRQNRHSSAFSVPAQNTKSCPINFSIAKFESNHSDSKENFCADTFPRFNIREKPKNKTGTNYIMQNITSIYTDISPKMQEQDKDGDVSSADDKRQSDDKEKGKCKDLSALIGLELVVDYVKQEKPKANRQCYSPGCNVKVDVVDSDSEKTCQ